MALGNIGDARAIKPLIDVVKYPFTDYQRFDDDVYRAAKAALVMIGSPAVAPLNAALRDKSLAYNHRVVDVLREIDAARAEDDSLATLKD
jgi:HEAT repeat protein